MNFGRKRILVVDDDPAVTELLQFKLDTLYDVVSINDPRQAYALASALQPDVVVCDTDMPCMDGSDVCQVLAEDPKTSAIPFLYLTPGEGPPEIEGRPAVAKNAPLQEIAACIAQAIQGRRAA